MPSERATACPFTKEDAAAWAQVCTRLSVRWGQPVMGLTLHLSMEANWTDALNMWVWTQERTLISKFLWTLQPRAIANLNNSRAFGMADSRARYADHLYRMLQAERRVAE
jgi:hypothetical protein